MATLNIRGIDSTSAELIVIDPELAGTNVSPPCSLFSCPVAQEYFGFSLGGLANSIAGGTDIDFGVDVAASATTYTLEVQIIGYLL